MIAANREFHFEIFAAGQRQPVAGDSFITQAWDTLDPYRVLSYRRMWLQADEQLLPGEILAEHRRILEALESGDRELVRLLLHERAPGSVGGVPRRTYARCGGAGMRWTLTTADLAMVFGTTLRRIAAPSIPATSASRPCPTRSKRRAGPPAPVDRQLLTKSRDTGCSRSASTAAWISPTPRAIRPLDSSDTVR